MQGVLPCHEHLEEHALVARQGIERSDGPAVFGRCVGRQRVEIPHGRSGILYLACMDKFIEQHADRINGALGCPRGPTID